MRKTIITAIACLATAMGAAAQNTAMSPYTRYGYGNLSDNATSAQRAMGGTGYAMNSGRQINVMNPASYAAMDSLTFLFDMGADFTILRSHEGERRERQLGGGLDYITMQVPIMRGLGASVGLLPFSSVGYSFGNGIDFGTVRRSGDGSINQLYLGVGGQPVKGLGIGVNVAYLFGSTTNSLYALTNGGSTSLFERTLRVRDWRMDIGVQYGIDITRNNRLTLGVVYSPAKKLHGDMYGIYYDASVDNIKVDTVNAGDTKIKGRMGIPGTWGAGINFNHANRLMAEVDFTWQPWSKAKYEPLRDFENGRLDDRWRIGAGLQYTPAVRGSYLQRVNYRIGAAYNRDYIMVGDNHVRDLTLSAGLGLPVPGFKTIINLGFEYRNRRATPDPLLKEQYFNITLGVNFNEMWFRKNKLY